MRAKQNDAEYDISDVEPEADSDDSGIFPPRLVDEGDDGRVEVVFDGKHTPTVAVPPVFA